MSEDTTFTNTPVTITISEEEFQAQALSDGEFDLLTEWVKACTIRTARNALTHGGFSPEDRSEILQSAVLAANSVAWDTVEGSKLLNTPQGNAYACWLMVHRYTKREQREFTSLFCQKEHLHENQVETTRVFLRSFPDAVKKMKNEKEGSLKNE